MEEILKFSNYLKDLAEDERMPALKKYFGTYINIKGDKETFRMILSDVLFNGISYSVLINSKTFDIMAVTPRKFYDATQVNISEVNSKIAKDEYDLFFINDGTVVTAYQYDGKWGLMTSSSYDVTTMVWCAPLTFAEVINDVLIMPDYDEFREKTGYRFTDDRRIVFDNVTDQWFTFAFRHWMYHPTNMRKAIWDTGFYTLPPNCGPMQHLSLLSTCHLENKPTYKTIDNIIDDLKESEPAKIKYGIILRSKSGTGILDVAFERDLLIRLKRHLYTFPKLSYIRPDTRWIYQVIRAINGHYYDQFVKDISANKDYKEFACQIYQDISTYAQYVLAKLKNRNGTKLPLPILPPYGKYIIDPFLRNEKIYNSVDLYSKNANNILMDLLTSDSFAVYYLCPPSQDQSAPAELQQ